MAKEPKETKKDATEQPAPAPEGGQGEKPQQPPQKDWAAVRSQKPAKPPKKEQPFEELSSPEEPEKLEQPEVHQVLDHPDYRALADKVESAEEKANKFWNQFLEAQAELENTLRRAERDVANAHKYGQDKFLVELLPVVDSLERGLEIEHKEDAVLNNMHDGMQLTLDMFLGVLKKFGVEQIDPMNKPFNPEHHEAMSVQTVKDARPNTVLQVIQKGYLLNGRLVRAARVIVSKG